MSDPTPDKVELMRADDRPETRSAGVLSRHSFSFGTHYDPYNVGFGLLVVANDDNIAPGAGYPAHPHRDVEIVTWVLDGALTHRDSTGGGGVISPGLAQRMSAGGGVRHAELNEGGGLLRFVQMWVCPDEPGGAPSYQQGSVVDDLATGGLITVASGLGRDSAVAAVGLGQRHAAFHVGRLEPGADVVMPNAPFVHTYVARGSVDVESVGRLGEGDALRLTDEGGRRIRAIEESEVLVWEMHATVFHRPSPPGSEQLSG